MLQVSLRTLPPDAPQLEFYSMSVGICERLFLIEKCYS